MASRTGSIARQSLSTGDPSPVADRVRAVLSTPEGLIDFAAAKFQLDALVDPDADFAAAAEELDRLTAIAGELAGPAPANTAKLEAIRKLLYDSGPWNDHRPFAYDQSDPDGQRLQNKLLHNYLATRLGQCVSMPILFLILADRLGLSVRLATAPEHVLLRYIDAAGRAFNIEATSGGLPARDEWYRRNFPMTDRAIGSGIYLRTLNRAESVATMAGVVLEHLWAQRRDRELIAVTEAILQHDPRDIVALLFAAHGYARTIETEFIARYPLPILIPGWLRPRYMMLEQRNLDLFAAAEALGWEEPDSPTSGEPAATAK